MDMIAEERSVAGRPARTGWLFAAASFVLALLGVVACAEEEAVVPDAADRLEDLDVTRWFLPEEMSFRISEVEWAGRSIPLFPIIHANFRPNGELLVGVGGAEQVILRLGGDGDVFGSAGRPGDGPGEFVAIGDVADAGDEFLVWDTRLRRWTRFDEHGGMLGSVRPEIGPGWRLLGSMQGDELIMAPSMFSAMPGEQRTYEIWAASGTLLGQLRGPEEPQGSLATMEVRDGERRSTFRTDLPRCLVRILEAVGDDAIYVANSVDEPGVLMALQEDGSREIVYQTQDFPLVTDRLLEEVGEAFELAEGAIARPRRAPDGGRVHEDPALSQDSMRAILDRVGVPGTPLPAWRELVLDQSSRHVWLRPNSCREFRDHVWEIVDMDGGGLLAAAIIPDSIQVWDVQFPRLLAVTRDSLDVEHLVVMELTEEGSGT